jgi:hypothetical protein
MTSITLLWVIRKIEGIQAEQISSAPEAVIGGVIGLFTQDLLILIASICFETHNRVRRNKFAFSESERARRRFVFSSRAAPVEILTHASGKNTHRSMPINQSVQGGGIHIFIFGMSVGTESEQTHKKVASWSTSISARKGEMRWAGKKAPREETRGQIHAQRPLKYTASIMCV